MKYLNKILDYCTDFINEIDDFEDVALGTDFSCYPTTNEVQIALVASAVNVDSFRENLYSRTAVRDISEFTWSLLHEVGHCMTWNYMNKRTQNHCRNIKRKINRGSLPEETYYGLTDERIATDWAIKFVEGNHDFVKEFDTAILNLLNKFYKVNKVEGCY
jgi:hypothetical protein